MNKPSEQQQKVLDSMGVNFTLYKRNLIETRAYLMSNRNGKEWSVNPKTFWSLFNNGWIEVDTELTGPASTSTAFKRTYKDMQ